MKVDLWTHGITLFWWQRNNAYIINNSITDSREERFRRNFSTMQSYLTIMMV